MNANQAFPKCAVCTRKAHGFHFGVLSCRACAAFFRRTIVANRKYTCNVPNSICDVTKPKRFVCRMCRYNKCIELGMTPDNVRFTGNIPHLSSVDENFPTDLSLQPGSSKDKHKKMPSLLNLTPTLEFISAIFDRNEPSVSNDSIYYNSLNNLEKMNYGLREYRSRHISKKIVFDNKLSLNKTAKQFAEQMCRVANWLMHSEDFRRTSIDDKLTIFRITWSSLRRFERLNMAVEVFGKKVLDEKILLISDDTAVNVDNLEMDISVITDQPASVFKNMFFTISNKFISDVAKPLYDISPTSIELTYMLYLIVWSSVGKEMDGIMKDISEKCIEEAGNNLHDYYVKDQKTRNYAARLIKLNAIVNRYQKLQTEHNNIMELANLFDFFKAQLFDPFFLV